MKTIKFVVALALTAAVFASCEKEPQDVQIVGDITLTGEYTTYLHGGNGWLENDVVGVFVTSDGFPQKNLEYKPSEVLKMVESPYVPGYFLPGDPVGNVTLTPAGTAAGFKAGEHNIYAYVPYAAGNEDLNAIPLPDLTVQNPVPDQYSPDAKYNFAYASIAPFSEYSAAAKDFGNFKSAFVQMTVPSPDFPADVEGKKLTKVVVSADTNIATKKATIDLTNGQIAGDSAKTIEYVFAGEGEVLAKGFFGVSAPTLYLVLSIDEEAALATTFTFKYVVDGKEYTCSGRPVGKDSPMYMAGNLNMYGNLAF